MGELLNTPESLWLTVERSRSPCSRSCSPDPNSLGSDSDSSDSVYKSPRTQKRSSSLPRDGSVASLWKFSLMHKFILDGFTYWYLLSFFRLSPSRDSASVPRRSEISRTQSCKSSANQHRVFRASDLQPGEVLGKGFFGQAIKVGFVPCCLYLFPY